MTRTQLTRLCLLVLAALAGYAPGSEAQRAAAFDPFPNNSAVRYHFDLARNFFASPAIEAKARSELLGRLERLRTIAPTSTRSPADLLRALQLQDSLQREVGKHLAYLSLRSLSNTRDTLAQRFLNEFSTAATPGYRAVDVAIAATRRSRIDSLRRSLPALERYAYSIDQVYRFAARQPSPQAAAAIARLAPQAESWGPAQFRTTMAELDLGTVATPEGPLDLRRQGAAIRSHPNRAVREEGFKRNNAALATQRSTFASILTRTAEARNELARLRGFADYPEESYAERFLTRADVAALLSRLATASSTYRAYEALRRERIQRALGYNEVHVWDLTAPIGTQAPQFTINAATDAIIAAARPLGAAYVTELRALLDPRNGRLDVAPGPNRVDRPGFSTGLVGYPSMFYQGRFAGFTEDIVILAHEAGHAVQNMLMDRRGVLPRYAAGASYFTESFGVFAELMTLRHLFRTERDTALKIFYLERLLDQSADLARNAAEAAVEQAMYDSVAAGRRLDADAIERLMQNIGSQYSSSFGPNSERQLAWVQPIQFYTWPLYRLNYVYARVLALAYIDLLEKDAGNFVPRFNELLSRGYDATPEEILARSVGLSLKDPTLVQRSAGVVARWIEDLRTLYRARPRAGSAGAFGASGRDGLLS
jgi:oligoendopeptidase F